MGLALAIGLLMEELRKDQYVLVAFHSFINMWLTYGDYSLTRMLHLSVPRRINSYARRRNLWVSIANPATH